MMTNGFHPNILPPPQLAIRPGRDRAATPETVRARQRMPGIVTYAAVILAILVGTFLRYAYLQDIPPGLNQDEAVNGYDAYSLFLTGRDHHGHPFPFAGLESFGDWASPVLTFLTVPAVGVLGLRVESVRGVAAALGVLSIPLIYRV